MEASSFQQTLQLLKTQLQASADENRRLMSALKGSQSPKELCGTPAEEFVSQSTTSDCQSGRCGTRLNALEDILSHVQTRLRSLEDLVHDPTRFTPPCSIASDSPWTKIPSGRKLTDNIEPVQIPWAQQEPVPAYHEPHLEALLNDAVIFYPELNTSEAEDLPERKLDLYTDDVRLFTSKLRRVARFKKVTNVARFLKGSALRFHNASLSLAGEHEHEWFDGALKIEQFCHDIESAFPWNFVVKNSETTLSDIPSRYHVSQSLMHDYAVPLMEQARRSATDKTEAQRREWVYQRILAVVPGAETISKRVSSMDSFQSMSDFWFHLRCIEAELTLAMDSSSEQFDSDSETASDSSLRAQNGRNTDVKGARREMEKQSVRIELPEPRSPEPQGQRIPPNSCESPIPSKRAKDYPIRTSRDDWQGEASRRMCTAAEWAQQLNVREALLAQQKETFRDHERLLESRERGMKAPWNYTAPIAGTLFPVYQETHGARKCPLALDTPWAPKFNLTETAPSPKHSTYQKQGVYTGPMAVPPPFPPPQRQPPLPTANTFDFDTFLNGRPNDGIDWQFPGHASQKKSHGLPPTYPHQGQHY